MKDQGFTLIEMLIVIAIIGILAAIGMGSFLRWRATSAVLDGAHQFAQAVNAARTGAKKANACWQVGLPTTSSTQYEVRQFPTPNCSGTASSSRTYTMPAGTTLTLTSNGGGTDDMNFSPPYATTDSSPNTYSVRWASNTGIFRTVRITSILGKVVIK